MSNARWTFVFSIAAALVAPAAFADRTDLFGLPDNPTLLSQLAAAAQAEHAANPVSGDPVVAAEGEDEKPLETCSQALSEPLALANIFSLCPPSLETMYKTSTHGPIPNGDTRGKAAFNPGSLFSPFEQLVLRGFWSGKVFTHHRNGTVTLINKTLIGRKFPAKVYIGKSLMDGGESIIIDYTEDAGIPIVGPVVASIRDEIRRVGPNLYLGYAFMKRGDGYVNVLPFALDASPRPKGARTDRP